MDYNEYYSRQMRLPGVGLEGQGRLQAAKCLIVGAGGLGAPALLYLAAAGIGTLGICDGDVLEVSNLHRQPIYDAKDIGQSKAELAAARVKALNPQIKIITYPFRLTAENAIQLFSNYDLVLDCTDNFRTKFLINDAAFFSKKGVVRASIYQYEGQLQVYLPHRNDACLRCLWETMPQEGCVGTCQEVGVLGPIPGHFGVLQAMEAIKFFLGLQVLGANQILFADLIHYLQRVIGFDRNKNCPLCGDIPTISRLHEREFWEISEGRNGPFCLVDIRESQEIAFDPYTGGEYRKMPLSSFDEQGLSPEIQYLFFCQRGSRSFSLVRRLRDRGFTNVFSLTGGIGSLR